VIGTCAEGKADVGKATGVDELITLKEYPGTSYEDLSIDARHRAHAVAACSACGVALRVSMLLSDARCAAS